MTLPEVLMMMVTFSLLVFPFIIMTHTASQNAQSWETRMQQSVLLRKLLSDVDPWHQNFIEDYDTTVGANNVPYDIPATCPNNARCPYLTVVDSSRNKLVYYVRQAVINASNIRTVTAYTYGTASEPEFNATPNFISASVDVTPQEIYVDCGSTSPYVDTSNIVWRGTEAFTDTWGYTGSPTIESNGSTSVPLFTHYQTIASSGSPRDGISDLEYKFTLPEPETAHANPRYQIELYMMEPTASAAGERLFDVIVNGARIASNVDIYTASGGTNIPYVFTTTQSVTNGLLTIGLENALADSGSNGPVLSAIHIKRVYQL